MLSINPQGILYRLLAVAMILSIAFGGLATRPAAADAAGATTTSALNLRSGPGTANTVLLVIPSGAAVEVTGAAQAGFFPVTYRGTSGFASASFLTIGGGGGSAVTSGGPTGIRYVVDGSLNFRSGPSTSDGVLAVLRAGSAVQLTGEQANGFARVTFNGATGWAFAQFLSTTGGSGTGTGTPAASDGVAVGDSVTGSATVVNGPLNQRRGPGTTFAVIRVLPNGAVVEVMGGAQSGFLPIRSNGVKGWASAMYLSTGGAATPSPSPALPPVSGAPVPVGSTVTDYKITTAAINVRSGPAMTYGLVTTLPPGTKVDIMGSASGAYLPVRWARFTGWAISDRLVDVSTAPAPVPTTGQGADMVAIIYAAADKWGQPRADMLRVARCESLLDPRAVNKSSGASGLFQFMPSTFAFTPNGKAGQSIFDPVASADAAGWMWKNGMRNHWACQ
ncbi:MAG: SH3 domain-containing protein [Chloroflexia bacterium]|nr:SH3 domain-containing protein [Chloroflexia bacterium]